MSSAAQVPTGAVVIGASAGAIEALSTILPGLPADYALPVLIVVHLPPDKDSMLASLFAAKTQLPVKEAEDKEPVRGGYVYFAPPDYHLLIEPDFILSLNSDEPVLYSRPSIDVLFESAADAWGDSVTGVLLTGASADGARGLRAIQDAGGRVLVQSPKTAECNAMPQAGLDACPGAREMTLREIANVLALDTRLS